MYDVQLNNAHEQSEFWRALHAAKYWHGEQKRKYTGEPYWTHCLAVAATVSVIDGRTLEMLQAALLHDTVEDTTATLSDIRDLFGSKVAEYVDWLTDVEAENRPMRVELTRRRLGDAPAEVQTIKLADMLDNTRSIVERDTDFARDYLTEKDAALQVLTKGDMQLRHLCDELIDAGMVQIMLARRFKRLG